jgi:hypothetical protein
MLETKGKSYDSDPLLHGSAVARAAAVIIGGQVYTAIESSTAFPSALFRGASVSIEESGRRRSRFRSEADQDSGGKPITHSGAKPISDSRLKAISNRLRAE